MTELVVRVAHEADDLVAAGALTAEAYRADGLIDDGDGYVEDLADAPRRAQEAMVLLALESGLDGLDGGSGLVGTVTLALAGSAYAEVARPGEAEIRMLAVDPAARRRGIAEALTRAAMVEAVGLGVRAVVLSTFESARGVHRLYERLGFTRVPDRDWADDDVELRAYAWQVPRGPGARVEAATWTPREGRAVAGWRVGLSGGFTRRANSVLALVEPDDVASSIDEVERIYGAAGLRPTFRVCAEARPAELDAILQARGYRDVAHTVVMVRDLGGVLDALGSRDVGAGAAQAARVTFVVGAAQTARFAFVVGDVPDDAWISTWLAVKSVSSLARPSGSPTGRSDSAGPPVDRELAAAIVSGSRAVYARAVDAGTTVGVVRAALVGEWVGLSCLMISRSARRRGVGSALTLEALRVAADRGATRAFLQVERTNRPAIALYEALGFLPATQYHYRER